MSRPNDGNKDGVGFFGWIKRLVLLCLLGAFGYGAWWIYDGVRQNDILSQIISRLSAQRRVADVYVEKISPSESGGQQTLRLKILEYDVDGKPLEPVHCTFSVNNVIHFEALVIRLDDELVKGGDGKSIYLFKRAFALDDDSDRYESCELSKLDEVPAGYRLPSGDSRVSEVERRFWKSFWRYAMDKHMRDEAKVRNAQIEAPATRFVPDKLYHLYIEADGGLLIEAGPIPKVMEKKRAVIKTKPSSHEVPSL